MSMTTERSDALFAEAQRLFPGGVNSPVRAFRGVGGTPRFIARGEGAWIEDVDGNRFIDYVLSWGPLILGHAHPAVVRAVQEQAARGMSFGAPAELESELARITIDAMPAVEMIRFVSTGTEATMSAIRLARAFTKRTKILKFEGCYHGHADPFLVQAGSGVATLGLPDSPGVPDAATAATLVAPYNDLAAVATLVETHGADLAAIIVEPIAGNMGFVLPDPDFLPGLRALADRSGALLIFDEVMTGFRVAWGGAQGIFGVTPDLTCLGKVIGGGLPAAAYGGRSEIMQLVAPSGPVYQAGTLSGNPLAMAAGIATLREMRQPGKYDILARATASLVTGFTDLAQSQGIPLQAASLGGMWGFFFTDQPVRHYADAKRSDATRFTRFFHAMLARGVYLAPSPFEAAFISTAHDDAIIAQTLGTMEAALAAMGA